MALDPPAPVFEPKPAITQKRKLVTVRRIARMEEVDEDPNYVEINFEACSWPVLIPKTEDMPKVCGFYCLSLITSPQDFIKYLPYATMSPLAMLSFRE